MTIEMINEFIDASIRGTLIGITLFFWACGMTAIWKWVFGMAKRFIHWLFPNLKRKESNSKTGNK